MLKCVKGARSAYFCYVCSRCSVFHCVVSN